MNWRHPPIRKAPLSSLALMINPRCAGHQLDDLDVAATWVREICNDIIRPGLDADIDTLDLEAASGNAGDVPRIESSCSFFMPRSPGGCFCRLGGSKRELPPEALARLLQQRSEVASSALMSRSYPGLDLRIAMTN